MCGDCKDGFVNSGRKFPIVPFENSPTQNALRRRPTAGAKEASLHEPPFPHEGIRVWNGPEQSRGRWFCATQWTLHGEDRSARFELRKGGRLVVLLLSSREKASFPSILQPVTLPTDVDGGRVMQEAIEDGSGDDRVAKD